MAAKRPPRGSHPPGTFWYYNNWDFNALGTIYEHATGTGIYDALYRLIARPIGMQDYRPEDGSIFHRRRLDPSCLPDPHERARSGTVCSAVSARGQLGRTAVVPPAWVRESTRPYSSSGFGPGYGYLWWTGTSADGSQAGVRLPSGSFFAWGAGGQYAFVIPAHDLVVVSRVDRDLHLPEPKFALVATLLQLMMVAGGFDPAR